MICNVPWFHSRMSWSRKGIKSVTVNTYSNTILYCLKSDLMTTCIRPNYLVRVCGFGTCPLMKKKNQKKLMANYDHKKMRIYSHFRKIRFRLFEVWKGGIKIMYTGSSTNLYNKFHLNRFNRFKANTDRTTELQQNNFFCSYYQ